MLVGLYKYLPDVIYVAGILGKHQGTIYVIFSILANVLATWAQFKHNAKHKINRGLSLVFIVQPTNTSISLRLAADVELTFLTDLG